MSYESKLRFGFAGTAKVLTRFIYEAISADSEFEDALADLVLIKRDGIFFLVNQFDKYKGFGSNHPYFLLYSFGYQCSQKYLQEDDFGEEEQLYGAYLRIGEEPDDVETAWFGECARLHYAIGIVRIEFSSGDPNFRIAEGYRIRKGMPELGCYSDRSDFLPRVVDGNLNELRGVLKFALQEHLGGSLHAAIALMNPEGFSAKAELLTF